MRNALHLPARDRRREDAAQRSRELHAGRLLRAGRGVRGLFLGCGMNSVVATGGGAGMALAHCIVHGHAPMDLHEADPKRFPSCFNCAASGRSCAGGAGQALRDHVSGTPVGDGPAPVHAARRCVASGERALRPGLRLRTAALLRRDRGARTHLRQARVVRPGGPRSAAGARGSQSTFGKIRVAGRDAKALECTATCRPRGRAVYSLMLSAAASKATWSLRLDDEEYGSTSAPRRSSALAWSRGIWPPGRR